jgi:proteic killer suppression protein
VIRSFADLETENVFRRVGSRRLPADLQRIAYRKLVLLDAADTVNDLRIPPGNRLEKLRGDRAGQYSIRINNRWRVCFTWQGSDAYDVQIVDYH